MLRVRNGFEAHARYVAARLSFADDALRLLIRYGEPLPLATIVEHLQIPDVPLLDALHQDFRFGEDAAGRFHLRAQDELVKAAKLPILTLLDRCLFWRGLPTSIHHLAAESSYLKDYRYSPESLGKMMSQSDDFIASGDQWLLTRWLEDEAQLEPGFALVGRDIARSQNARCRSAEDPITLIVTALRNIQAPVPFGLVRTLPILCLISEREALRITSECEDVVFLRNGHLAMSDWLDGVRAEYRSMSATELRRLDQEFREVFERHAIDDDYSSLLLELRRAAAKSALHHLRQHQDRMVDLSELLRMVPNETQILERLGAHQMSEHTLGGLASRLRCEVKDDLLPSLCAAGALFLPGGKVAALVEERVCETADSMCQPISGFSTEELCGRLWPDGTPPHFDGTALVEYLAPFGIEYTEGYWHAGRERFRLLFLNTAEITRKWLALQSGPAPIEQFIRRALCVAEHCPGPVWRVLTQVAETAVEADDDLWWLPRGRCWASPKALVTPERLEQLISSGVSNKDAAHCDWLCDVLGFELSGLSDEERSILLEAFRAALPRRVELEPLSLVDDPVSLIEEQVEPLLLETPPRRSRTMLTEEALRNNALPLERGAMQIIEACFGDLHFAVHADLLVEGQFAVSCWVVSQGRRLVSRDLFRWLAERQAAPGDFVVLYAPVAPRQAPHVALELATETGASTGGHRGPALHLRERIAAQLSQRGQAMHIDDLLRALLSDGGHDVAKASVAAILSANNHAFAAWGRAIWGLREWADDWTDYINPQLLAWRIDDDDLVVCILAQVGHPLSYRQIAAEIARRLLIRVEQVLEITLPIREDDRLHTDGTTGRVSLTAWRRHTCPLLRYCALVLRKHPHLVASTSRWFLRRWHRSLETSFSEHGVYLREEGTTRWDV